LGKKYPLSLEGLTKPNHLWPRLGLKKDFSSELKRKISHKPGGIGKTNKSWSRLGLKKGLFVRL
jgi:hypothetical protein